MDETPEAAAGDFGTLAGGTVSVRIAAGVVVAGAFFGGATGFFSAAFFRESCGAEDGMGFEVGVGLEAGGISRCTSCAANFGGAVTGAEAAEADGEEPGRRARIFGSAMMATITKSTAATGTT